MRSMSQKTAASRHGFESIPAAQPVPGASGRWGRAELGGGAPRTRRLGPDQPRSAGRITLDRRPPTPAKPGKRR